MACTDYPTCIWCGEEITHIELDEKRQTALYVCPSCLTTMAVGISTEDD